MEVGLKHVRHHRCHALSAMPLLAYQGMIDCIGSELVGDLNKWLCQLIGGWA